MLGRLASWIHKSIFDSHKHKQIIKTLGAKTSITLKLDQLYINNNRQKSINRANRSNSDIKDRAIKTKTALKNGRLNM